MNAISTKTARLFDSSDKLGGDVLIVQYELPGPQAQ